MTNHLLAEDPADQFSPLAQGYVLFRPRYPRSIYDYLLAWVPHHKLAWDAGCGSGQATLDLAERFDHVVGTDISDAQIAAAPAHPKIEWRVAPADASGLADASVDLITCAQSLHWFPLDAFYAEANRVLVPGGMIAAWTYGTVEVDHEEIDALVQAFRTETLGALWNPERAHVDTRYAQLPFPFEEIQTPPYTLSVQWTLAQLLGYLRSWSACGRYVAMYGIDPTQSLSQKLLALWGHPQDTVSISWPLTLRIGRKA
ncbi:class I SAM-dependent methyltransferase [Niveibacterium sp. 24ML]|uniref:class I SAM-dependent methyltransferase n=1 Tax=Niveibacterium sp. 24ML TaxID=2985512 RepID=UPI002271066A|nr:class I SAM-dependent methyltransferase [Niveibacterium sp. 24ML]MCX9158002.1 class I SAM-dependent methyltransferase [Niveibacterium sp. 24ML]